MGEVVVVSSQSAEATAGSGAEAAMKDESLNGVGVRWERFLQRMRLRVLLVEADDSTRQIISALLRKCGYRVAAVPDGLKAWEMLKGRSSSIDLILTEVDLPSICGFALLTLIMEHDICKTIPVIMMSSQDSISTVYKCMMKGAADYLVKPIRRNELRNLWQHVWRRQSSTAQRVEVTSENKPASNANVHSHKACGEKGSDAQSTSCTKPDLESERQESSHANHGSSFPGPLKLHRDEIDINSCQKSIMRENEPAAGFDFVTIENAMDEMSGAEAETHNMDADIACGNTDNVAALVRSSRNATNWIGAFGDCSSSNGTSNFYNASGLDLSLRRCHSSNIEHNLVAERHTLRTSNASAFSRYIHRPIQHPQLKFIEENRTPRLSDPRLNVQPKKTCPPPVQVKGVQFNVSGSGYGSVLSPIICAQPGLSPLTSPSTAAYPMNSFHQSDLENIDSEKLAEQLHRNSNNVARILSIADSKNEEADLGSSKDLHRSSQREAALTKFRLKRKDRCFEKKVRYESRKKLAEQRPRVKGQFVRQLNANSRPPQTTEN